MPHICDRGLPLICMSTLPWVGPLWWDRDFDRQGRRIRPDVRKAAHEIWAYARARTRSALGDESEAAEIMELSVDRISRYLDRREIPLFSINVAGLMTAAFRRQLQKRQLKAGRMEFVGGASEMESLPVPDRSDQVNRNLDLQKIIDRLSPRSTTILLRRREGIDWKTIALELGLAESTCQNSFWREVRQAQLDLLIMPKPGTSKVRSRLNGGTKAISKDKPPNPS
jgi:DNA-directed RNA polymerase specialized sigma24 family protein